MAFSGAARELRNPAWLGWAWALARRQWRGAPHAFSRADDRRNFVGSPPRAAARPCGWRRGRAWQELRLAHRWPQDRAWSVRPDGDGGGRRVRDRVAGRGRLRHYRIGPK